MASEDLVRRARDAAFDATARFDWMSGEASDAAADATIKVVGDEAGRLRSALEQIAQADQGIGVGRYELIEIAIKALTPSADSVDAA